MVAEPALLVPMNALDRVPAELIDELAATTERVVRSGWYVLGPNVEAFEKEFAAYCGVRHAHGVANGTDALELALRAAGCGPGDLVATVANAGMYAAAAIVACGARPVWIDIDSTTMTMDPMSLEKRWRPEIKAIIATHLYGWLADMTSLVALAKTKGVLLVEDCAQAHGATRNGIRAGAFGDLAAFSFYPTKNLGAFGDAGAITSHSDALAARVKALRQYGWANRYDAQTPGGRNSRLDEMQAAILRVMLPHLDGWNARRREIATRVSAAARSSKAIRIEHAYGSDHVAHLLVGLATDREAVRSALRTAGVATDVHYPIPDHKQGAFTGMPEAVASLPVTEALSKEVFSLPCFPWLREDEVSRVEEAVASV